MQRIVILILAALASACSATPPALVNTKWVAVEINGVSVLQGTRPTLEFTEDKRVAGSGGCNRYGGGVELDGSSIKFGALVSTRMACADQAAMHQESRLFSELEAVRSYRREGADLVLLSADGKILVRFEPQ